MPFAIPFPDLSPDLFTISIGSFQFALRWYALAYIVGLVAGWWLIVQAVKRPALWPGDTAPMRPDRVEGLLTAVVLGVILGGRIGFVVFYQPGYYLQNPGQILQVWQGGMSFHGGLIGVALAGYLFCKINKVPPLQVADAMAMVVAIGLGLGRLANFINAELWGRPTDVAWGVIFPGEAAQACRGPVGIVATELGEMCARHPSQLYQAGLEGLVMGAVLLWLAWSRGWLRTPGALTGMFFAIYGVARFAVEFVRQPDAQFMTPDNPVGFALALSPSVGLTMGQILSLPMIAAGLWLVARSRRGA
ncbi:prolipoprotein diacylglyceryl transferase [Roseicyclus mahoneyensis]|jgi:phosphatidylglycerol---prolipoprotein diacylglyceryl transferase|uniref:Phosphatidylglycerol--prolipoprotein diacylglyceryl transferase n=1 Tax=Roseicyclus mahoneyensis TaxID=164332 RepID=A0A316GFX4_9RHOB|nr:prolipoprotein diacylglyceryl transferase [Roseicyclus mahoneyensis]PWK59535.1 prolipoprotein diacylglyceryl transferase [Roseicyclus mahoneyensis]